MIVVLVLILSTLGVAIISTGNVSNASTYEPFDIGPKLRGLDTDTIQIKGDASSASGLSTSATETILDEKVWFTYDDYYGGVFWDLYYLRAESEFTEVWIQADRSYPDGHTDPITDEQAQYILNEYDSNIHPIDTGYFGPIDPHDGSNSLLEAWGLVPPGYYYSETGKDIVMVSNVRDDMYYDPSYPYFIIGFYWGTFEAYFDRNMITIDSYNWENWVNPDGGGPYQYESTVAHELQHLIHADHNPSDDTFMNEGCSLFAEMLCGYGADWPKINSYLATPDNSLTEWSDHGGINILADYGAALLFAIYLNDHYGESFLGTFVQSGLPGIYGLNYFLGLEPFETSFLEVYHNWRIANLIHWGDGLYNYKSIDLNGKDVEQARLYEVPKLPVPWMTGSDFGSTITILDYDTGKTRVKPFGTDYIRFDAGKYISEDWAETLYFDGGDIAIFGWQEVQPDLWWSDDYDWMNLLLVADEEIYIDSVDSVLEITTYWDIEDEWDYGFIQVSTDGGVTWTSLANEYTIIPPDPDTRWETLYYQPGLTSWSVYFDDDDDGWITMEFSLSDYVGQEVLVGFRYITDWYTTYEGWYISEASVDGQQLDLAPNYPYPGSDFQVSLIYELKGKNKFGTKYTITDLDLDVLHSGQIDIEMELPSYVYLVVSPIQPVGHVDYGFQVTTTYVGN